jgi:ribonuclease-3
MVSSGNVGSAVSDDSFNRVVGGQLGHVWADPPVLSRALGKTICVEDEHQRMELAGDRILHALLTERIVLAMAPIADRTELENAVRDLSNNSILDECAREHRLYPLFRFSRDKSTRKAGDMLEAVVAAAVMDGGWDAGRRVVSALLGSRLSSVTLERNLSHLRHDQPYPSEQEWLAFYKVNNELRGLRGAEARAHFYSPAVAWGDESTLDQPLSRRRLVIAALVNEIPAGNVGKRELACIGEVTLKAVLFFHWRFSPSRQDGELSFSSFSEALHGALRSWVTPTAAAAESPGSNADREVRSKLPCVDPRRSFDVRDGVRPTSSRSD